MSERSPCVQCLVARTLDEQRDIKDARSIFGDAGEIRTGPEMVQLAQQPIDRRDSGYDPSDLEDHTKRGYER